MFLVEPRARQDLVLSPFYFRDAGEHAIEETSALPPTRTFWSERRHHAGCGKGYAGGNGRANWPERPVLAEYRSRGILPALGHARSDQEHPGLFLG